MEKKKKNLEPHVPQNNRRSANPSFSSTLLESIYRSIDEKPGIEKPEAPVEDISMSTSFYHSMKKKHNNFSNNAAASAVVLSNSNSNSSSSSNSESSSFWSGGLSSSSDSESAHYYYYGSRSSSSMQRPKPVRTERSSSYGPSKKSNYQYEQQEKAAKMMSKAALKIYNQLKKVKNKQPISPGGKLSSFLNSLFTHPKKQPKNKPTDPSSSIITSNSNCSSSYTRSCLTKTPSTSKLSHNGSKRSVRFFPVSVIVDGDSQPCGHKKLIHREEEDDDELIRVMEENRKVAEAAKKLILESYRKPKMESYGGMNVDDDSEDEDNDDDGMSCASSDLFELNNLSDIGRYSEELPVYETTHVHTNRAIANGLIV